MAEKIVIVLDCGATNVRAVAVNDKGEILAKHSIENTTRPDPDYSSGLIWDVDEIWTKFCTCTQKILPQIHSKNIAAVTVTTFGVNGAPVDSRGKLLYPVISWQCQRTDPYMDKVEKLISLEELYAKNGVGKYSFNTLYTLMWLKDYKPELLDQMAGFLFISSIFINRLSGELVNDHTMAGTSMLTDIKEGGISSEILNTLSLPNKFFELEQSGNQAGTITTKASQDTLIPEGIPVVLAGHDTQFALVGSGARENEVVLSSGTWEILMARSPKVSLTKSSMLHGLTHEQDAQSGLYNAGIQWLASGTLEWILKTFYASESGQTKEDIYNCMIEEASNMEQHNENLRFSPDLDKSAGIIQGIGMNTTRAEIYFAALKSLSESTKKALEILEENGGFKSDSLIVVGGGGRNKLWNQLRANAIGRPIRLAQQKETTVLGAAMISFLGVGIYSSIEEVKNAFNLKYDWIYPEQ